MVIPINGSMMGPPLLGPPPAHMDARFKQIKLCVLGLGASVIGMLLATILLGLDFLNMLISSFNLIINIIFGIYLLKDDETLARAHNCLQTTIFQSCADQCQSGMACLQPFFIVNALTVILNLLFSPGDLGYVFGHTKYLFEPAAWPNGLWGFSFFLMFVSTLGTYISQIAGAWLGYKAYKEAQMLGTESTMGSWAAERTSGGGGGGGGRFGGFPPAQESTSGTPAQPTTNFQAFHGSGNRLGGTN